jgi:hypothetical protein
MWLTAPTLFLGHPVFESICNIFSFNSFIQGVPDLAPQRKKGALGRIYVLTCILKKKRPISNDNREKTF